MMFVVLFSLALLIDYTFRKLDRYIPEKDICDEFRIRTIRDSTNVYNLSYKQYLIQGCIKWHHKGYCDKYEC